MTAVEVQVRSPATAGGNGWDTVPAVPIAVDDPDMTRERRKALVALRRIRVAEWRAGLERLPHFNSAFPYDIVHEYGLDWTTDPDYSHDAVRRLELNRDGTVSSEKPKNKFFHVVMLKVLLAVLGRRAVMEPRLHFGPELGAAAGLFTKLGDPSIQVEPDFVVLPPGTELSNSQIWDSTYDIHLDAGHPLPVLVGEILSDSTATRDLEGKRKLYETLGITEYVLCDVLGGLLAPHEAGVPRMSVYGLQPDGRYALAPIDPPLSEAAMPAYASRVLGTCVRLQGPRDPLNAPEDARFQWWDTERSCWRDPVTDQEQERLAEAVGAVRLFLGDVLSPAVLDRIESAWHRHAPPDGHLQSIHAVLKTPAAWRTLLPNEPEAGSEPAETPLGTL